LNIRTVIETLKAEEQYFRGSYRVKMDNPTPSKKGCYFGEIKKNVYNKEMRTVGDFVRKIEKKGNIADFKQIFGFVKKLESEDLSDDEDVAKDEVEESNEDSNNEEKATECDVLSEDEEHKDINDESEHNESFEESEHMKEEKEPVKGEKTLKKRKRENDLPTEMILSELDLFRQRTENDIKRLYELLSVTKNK